MDGSSRRVLVWRELDSPECLELVMKGKKIVSSSWGLETVIERAAMDGAMREVLVQGVGRSTGLTLDINRSNLDWILIDQDRLTISFTSLLTPLSTGHP